MPRALGLSVAVSLKRLGSQSVCVCFMQIVFSSYKASPGFPQGLALNHAMQRFELKLPRRCPTVYIRGQSTRKV